MSCGIYKITNKINGHSYIGQSIDIERRWRQHINFPKENSKYPLYQAFIKYGVENFSFEIIDLCSEDKLNKKEEYYIAKYNTYNNGYNQTTGGGGSSHLNIKLSNEDILTIYDLLKESPLSQNDIAKIFNVGPDTISEINQGKTRRLSNFSYPIRQNWGKRVCIDCGVTLKYTALRCRKCQNLISRIAIRPSRNELKAMIRTLPFTKIAEKYKVSDNTVRKWCIAENLPSKKADIKNISDDDWKMI